MVKTVFDLYRVKLNFSLVYLQFLLFNKQQKKKKFQVQPLKVLNKKIVNANFRVSV